MDATKPTDQDLVSDLPAYIREARAAINAFSSGSGVGVTKLTIAAGSVALTVGTDLGRYGYEIVIVDAAGIVSIANILDGIQGQVKIFVFQDSNISIVDGHPLSGAFYLNQLPALSSFNAQTNDVLSLVNIGGDGVTVQGYWKELFRQNAMK